MDPVSIEDGERALRWLAEKRGISVEEMRKDLERSSQEVLRRMAELESLSNERKIRRINAWQEDSRFHQLTCGNEAVIS